MLMNLEICLGIQQQQTFTAVLRASPWVGSDFCRNFMSEQYVCNQCQEGDVFVCTLISDLDTIPVCSCDVDSITRVILAIILFLIQCILGVSPKEIWIGTQRTSQSIIICFSHVYTTLLPMSSGWCTQFLSSLCPHNDTVWQMAHGHPGSFMTEWGFEPRSYRSKSNS